VEFAQYQVQEMEDEGDDEEDDEFSSLSNYEIKQQLRQDSSELEEEGELERDIREAQPLQRAQTAPMKP